MANLEARRAAFAEAITASAGVPHSRLTSAFAATPREHYLGLGPWKVLTSEGPLRTDDPALVYQDVLVALDEERGINNGQPSLHAVCLAALDVQPGETVIHIGTGTGYYTAVLAELTGVNGRVFGYEIDPEMAGRAKKNLSGFAHVTVIQHSGAEGALPECDALYVSAGATRPLPTWLDALRPGGRLLFPLTPEGYGDASGAGGMLLVTRVREGAGELQQGSREAQQEVFDARFVSSVMIIPCLGGRDAQTAKKLGEAFERGGAGKVRSLWRNTPPDETCWVAGDGWWLSTAGRTERTA